MSATFSTLLAYPLADILTKHILIHLEVIDLFRFRAVSKQTYNIVCQYLQCCRELNLSKISSQIEWQHFELIIKKSTKLRRLNLAECKWIDEIRFNQLVSRFDQFEELNLSSCYKITNRTLTIIASNCPHLRRLNLRDCHNLDSATLSTISQYCPRLEALNLSNCWNLDNKALINLFIQLGTTLLDLVISNLYSISETSMIALSVHCSELNHLDISGCWRLGDESISFLVRLAHLNRIELVGCSGISLIGRRTLIDSDIAVIKQ